MKDKRSHTRPKSFSLKFRAISQALWSAPKRLSAINLYLLGGFSIWLTIQFWTSLISSENLLQRCIGGFTQNNNESLNALIWSFAPKCMFSGAKTVEIASYLAASIFNEDYKSLLKMMHVMNIKIGPNAFAICTEVDNAKISIADARSFEASKEGRAERRAMRSAIEEDFCEEESSFYEAGMAD